MTRRRITTRVALSNGQRDVEYARCKSCSEKVLWTLTEKGKRMPVDIKPAEDGNVFVFSPGHEHADLRSISIHADNPTVRRWNDERRLRFKSHFATCKYADEHRKADAR